jgi:hypothetical protein
MAHYVDLEPCDYIRFNPARRHLAISVGWLESAFEYSRGAVPSHFVDRLARITEINPGHPEMVMCGWHDCEFEHSARPDGSTISDPQFPSSSKRELYIPFKGCLFVSPENIGHYITVHNYTPPEQFIEAIERCPDFESDDYHEHTYRFFVLTSSDLGPVPSALPWS